MKKSLVIVLISLILITLIMSIGFVSATWFGDFWKKLTGKTTENDTTTPTCSDECSSNGAKQCSGDGYKTCENYDSDSCLEFSSVISCSSGETCVAGACVSNTFTCADSDGGKAYSTKGNVVANSPTSSIDVTDLCSDSSKLVEYFCNSDKTQSGETYTCPNGCSNGACVSAATNTTNQTGISCSDSDGGKDYYIKGNTISSNSPNHVDYCNGQSVAEYFCIVNGFAIVNGISSEYYSCPNGCSNGACVSTTTTNQTTCTDSDGGKNYNVKGARTYGSYTYSDYCNGDGTAVVELFCGPDAEIYTCPNGCSDGACVSTTTNQTRNNTTTNQTNATTSSTTTTIPTISTTSTTTASAGTVSGGGGSSGSSSSLGVFEETISIKEEIKENIKFIEEVKKITDKKGNEIKIKINAEINEDGSSVVREKRTFINKNGEEVKIEIKTEVKADGSATLERKIIINENEIKSELKILEKFEDDEIKLKAQLSNGNEREIKIMPDEASEIALEKLKSKGFNIELKEVGEGDNLRAVYIAKEDKDGRLIGLFKIKLKLEAQIDSETGKIISSEKPWWNFLVVKVKPIEISGLLGNQTNYTLPPKNQTNLTGVILNITNFTLPGNQTGNLTLNQTNITLPGNYTYNQTLGNQTGNNTTTNQTNQGTWCTDSDGGKNYNVKGNSYYGPIGSSTPISADNWDFCSSVTGSLAEYSCVSNVVSGVTYATTVSEWYTCPKGCSNGACI